MATKQKPRLSFLQIWNMSFGFLGIQMGFALQNGNASRILKIFGADVHELGWFWLVAPFTGLIVQPIIGHYSDKTWTKLGRRRPFFLAGAILACIGLIMMPRADIFVDYLPAIWVGAGFLMIMDASFNVAMEPFRALVADKLNSEQRTMGFSIQTVLIGIGAVVGSWLPYALKNWFGIGVNSTIGAVPANVVWSFFIGAVILIVSIIITVMTTSEYNPEEMKEFDEDESEVEESKGLSSIFTDFKLMPKTMRQLAWVQFFSWFALFGMWVYTTDAVANHVYGLPTTDSQSPEYNNAGDWVSALFGIYNAVSAVFAFFLPAIALKLGRKRTHAACLLIGGISMISIYTIKDPNLLIIPMLGVGIVWASILAMPYAILAGSIPSRKMGVYMGIFNFFIVLPQILNGIIGGPLIKYVYGGQPIYALVLSGASFFIAAFLVRNVDDVDDSPASKLQQSKG